MSRSPFALSVMLAGTLGLAAAAAGTESGGTPNLCPATPGVTDPNKDIKRGKCLFSSTTAFGQREPTAMFASCAGCHPDGTTDQALHAVQITDTEGNTVTVMRKAPNLRNVTYNVPLGWDGRHGGTPGDLESIRVAIMRAAFGAIISPVEMQGSLSSLSLGQFQALAAFLISRSPTAPGPETPTPAQFSRDTLDRVAVGRDVFFGKGQCSTCHPAPFFTDHRIRSNVVNPVARFDFSGDRGAGAVGTGGAGEFKTPSLHNFYPVASPFMHDGGLGERESQLFRFYQKSLGFTLTSEEQTGLHYWLQNCPQGAGRHPLTLPSTCF
jgi:cytochrome c peroxidase